MSAYVLYPSYLPFRDTGQPPPADQVPQWLLRGREVPVLPAELQSSPRMHSLGSMYVRLPVALDLGCGGSPLGQVCPILDQFFRNKIYHIGWHHSNTALRMPYLWMLKMKYNLSVS